MSARRHPERGAILVYTAVTMFVLIGVLVMVIDYGILMVGRHQAQNSADAGALAGAIALAFDDYVDRTDTGPAKTAAHTLALTNNVFAEAPDVDITTDVTFPPCPDDGSDACIRVDAYRNQARGNPLPMWFGPAIGLTEQGVWATATAMAAYGNASDCLKPWGVADKWIENTPVLGAPWTPASEYNRDAGALPAPDVYIPPDGDDPGTGFTLENDLGTYIQLKVGSPGDAINPGWFQALDLTGGGGDEYRDNISGCAGVIWKIGDDVPKENGNMVGPTRQGTEDLIALDPDAEWGGSSVINSCVGPPYTCSEPGYAQSPRIVAIPIFDLDHYLDTGGPGNGTVRIVNILGFFVDRVDNPPDASVYGYLATVPGLIVSGGGEVAAEASFVRTVQLVR
jgi:hypothetical protein